MNSVVVAGVSCGAILLAWVICQRLTGGNCRAGAALAAASTAPMPRRLISKESPLLELGGDELDTPPRSKKQLVAKCLNCFLLRGGWLCLLLVTLTSPVAVGVYFAWRYPAPAPSFNSSPLFPGSRIITPELGALINGWTNRLSADYKWARCYSSFTDDSTAGAFHGLCDAHAVTVMVAHNDALNHTFGGYVRTTLASCSPRYL